MGIRSEYLPARLIEIEKGFDAYSGATNEFLQTLAPSGINRAVLERMRHQSQVLLESPDITSAATVSTFKGFFKDIIDFADTVINKMMAARAASLQVSPEEHAATIKEILNRRVVRDPNSLKDTTDNKTN